MYKLQPWGNKDIYTIYGSQLDVTGYEKDRYLKYIDLPLQAI